MNWLDRAETLLSRLPIKNRATHRMVPFHLYRNQKILMEKIKEQWEKERKLRIIILKARRVGMSSLVDGLLWCYGLAFPNKNIKILSHLAGTSDELFRVPSDLSRACPGFPLADIQMKRIFFRHPGGDSTITLATAGTPESGRGGTLSALHLSEAAKYPAAEIFTAMITSVAKGDESIIVIESTANGREGPGLPFFEYWNDAVQGLNGYIPVFLSWLDDPACVLPAEGADDAPATDLEKELMAAPFHATKEQIAFMRVTMAAECRNLEHVWLTEYPHSPRVAFQVSGEPAFARDELAYAERTVKEPLCRGKFVRTPGTGFKFLKDSVGPVFLWRFPFDKNGKADGMKYYIGADSAAGVEGGDFAAYCVLCGQTGELAARFAEIVDPETLADQLDIAGRWFNNAMINPELTGGLGRWTLVKLRDVFRYPNICRWKGRFDRKRGKDISNALGFEMNNATRRLIIDATRSGLRMGMKNEPGGLQVHDAALVSQIDQCTLKEWRWEVEKDHDDILVAYAIACLTREEFPPPRMQFAPKTILDQPTPQGKLAEVGVTVQKSELDDIFIKEMKQQMRLAGLRANMRATGRKQIDRLAGI